MRDINQNSQYYYQPMQQPIQQPMQQPMYYQPQQGLPHMNYAFNRPYQQPQVPIQQNTIQSPNMYQMPPQMSQQQPMFYPPNRPFTQQLGGMGPSFPYPKQTQGKKTASQSPNIFAQFKTSDGNYDINKMINTAGTMVNTMNQITGMFKQVGGFFIK